MERNWSAYGVVQETREEAPIIVGGRQLTGWETVIFEVADAERPRVLEELRAAIEEAERLIDRWSV
jgi:hypothetical protein